MGQHQVIALGSWFSTSFALTPCGSVHLWRLHKGLLGASDRFDGFCCFYNSLEMNIIMRSVALLNLYVLDGATKQEVKPCSQ